MAVKGLRPQRCIIYHGGMDVEDALTVPEAARALNIDQVTVRRRLLHGTLQGRRVGARLWLIPRAEVERAKAAGRLRPGPKRRDS
jgi:excisionase family DNA binding protein